MIRNFCGLIVWMLSVIVFLLALFYLPVIQSDETHWQAFVISMSQYWAWPLVVMSALITFKAELRKLLSRVKSYDGVFGKLGFEIEAEKAAFEANAAIASEQKDKKSGEGLKTEAKKAAFETNATVISEQKEKKSVGALKQENLKSQTYQKWIGNYKNTKPEYSIFKALKKSDITNFILHEDFNSSLNRGLMLVKFNELEEKIKKLGELYNLEDNKHPVRIAYDLFDRDYFKIFNDLKVLRNKAVHEVNYEISDIARLNFETALSALDRYVDKLLLAKSPEK